jgi:cyclophilin family peptidyl-prolyl cis-trans isomerase/HEAT repeat protein
MNRLERWIAAGVLVALPIAAPSAQQRPRLGAEEVRELARLLMLEDRRELDTTVLARALGSSHPEVQRRAALAVGRIADPRAFPLLRRVDVGGDTVLAATIVFAAGQLRDSALVPWFDSLMTSAATPVSAAAEAAHALGKVRSDASRASLLRFLARAPLGGRGEAVAREALLSIGRFTTRSDLAPIARWSTATDADTRWRATWALFRPRDPKAVPSLLRLAADASSEVRSWAVRGLTAPQVDSSGTPRDVARTLLHAAARDTDRPTRTEALRALGTYDDSATIVLLSAALDERDLWIAVTAAEALGRLESRAISAERRLVAATAPERPRALRITAMQSLAVIAPRSAVDPAVSLAGDSSVTARLAALQTLARINPNRAREVAQRLRQDPVPALRLQAWQLIHAASDSAMAADVRRGSIVAALQSNDVIERAAALRRLVPWADSADLPVIFGAYERATRDSAPAAASAAIAAVAAIERRARVGARAFLTRFTRSPNAVVRRDADRLLGAAAREHWGPLRPADTGRPLAEYESIIQRHVLVYHDGGAPRAKLETNRGVFEVELYSLETPMAIDYLMRAIGSGALNGVEFGRVVANFVDQQRGMFDHEEVRDEVNRHRLDRGNMSWASAGLDTGRPGYTFGHTPQPHNEGDFTSMGRVVSGMDVVDAIALGDRVVRASMVLMRR